MEDTANSLVPLGFTGTTVAAFASVKMRPLAMPRPVNATVPQDLLGKIVPSAAHLEPTGRIAKKSANATLTPVAKTLASACALLVSRDQIAPLRVATGDMVLIAKKFVGAIMEEAVTQQMGIVPVPQDGWGLRVRRKMLSRRILTTETGLTFPWRRAEQSNIL